MLCQFVFSNYKCFKEEALLDFIAEPITDNSKSLIVDKSDGEEFLPVISIYGPNGGGKSSVLEALEFLCTYIIQKTLSSPIDEDTTKEDIQRIIKAYYDLVKKDKYHKFDPKCKDKPTTFDVLFRTAGREYKYQLSLVHSVISEENLYMRKLGDTDAIIIFEREEESCYLGEILDGVTAGKLNRSMPLISHIATNYNIDEVSDAVSWFNSISFANYDNPRRESHILLPRSKARRQKLFKMLAEMGINISELRVVTDSEGNIKNIYTRRTLENGKVFELPFAEESSGTRKLFSCMAEIMYCLREGQLVVADELDAKLHPKLLRYIIELFTDPKTNKKGAQLLITSHDITTMIPEVLRRDEIYFCALNPDNASKLYSLIAFRKENGHPPRKDEVYGKRYLSGHYGADPYITRIMNWGDKG